VKRVVLDTNVIVSGFLWGGVPRELLSLGRIGGIRLLTSLRMLNELGNTLHRRKFAPKLDGISHSPDSLVLAYSLLADIVECEALPRPIAPDPDDDWVIATAIAANADFIVTGDKPFLGVGGVGALRIVGVAEALEILDNK
jgi:uncharacterized protein